jgi:hypothetical protein
MKGIAKQIPVKLNDYVPGFKEIWEKSLMNTKRRKEQARREEDGQMGGRRKRLDGDTAYNTFPTIGSL